MPRHHNRAILSEITEKQLDPNKEYVAGKHGLTLSFNEKKKERKEGGQESESIASVPEVVATKINYDEQTLKESVKQSSSSKDEEQQEVQSPTTTESTPPTSNEVEDSVEFDPKSETNGEKDNKKKKVNKPKL